ncbi:MAG TPA: hypothetical protein VID70_03845 [Solirubrobacteraceae bacterium]|jgi:hypothetical protein
MLGRLLTLITAAAFGLLAPAATLSLLAPAAASAAPRDIAATHTYIQANYALARAVDARIASTQASIMERTEQFGRECGNVGAGSPQNEDAQKLSYEVAGALWSVSFGANAGPIHTFARAVKPLRWSSPKLTGLARAYAGSLLGLATLHLPDLCGDVRAWSASGFHTVPPATLRFDARVENLEPRTIAPRLLAPYESPADRGALTRTTHLESQLEANEFEVGFDDWTSLLGTLGLKQ